MKLACALVFLAILAQPGIAQTSRAANRGDLSWLDLLPESHRISPSEIARLETELESRPDDLALRARLLTHYFQHAMPAARMRHILWVVEHRPETRLAGSPVVRLDPRGGPLNTRGDYEKVRSVWLQQTAARPNNPAVAGNAGQFFEPEEPARAAGLLERAWLLDRDNKMRLAALAAFYARAITACELMQQNVVPRCSSPGWLMKAKAGLEASSHAELVGTVAENLLTVADSLAATRTWRDPSFASRLLQRARELQPDNARWRPR
jgi:hypothetical protein